MRGGGHWGPLQVRLPEIADIARASRGFLARRPEQIAGFFDGLELVPPGLVPCPRWRPDPDDAEGARNMDEYRGLGRK